MKNSKLTILFLLTMMSTIVTAQRTTGIYVDYNSSNVVEDFHEDKIELSGRFQSLGGVTVAAILSDKINDRFAASLGIGYSQKSYKIVWNELRWPSQIVNGIYLPYRSPGPVLGNQLGTHKFHYIVIPFNLSYKVADFGNRYVGIRAGLTTSILVQSSSTLTREETNGLIQGSRSVNLSSDSNALNFMTSLGLELGLYSSEAMDIALIPSVGVELRSTAKNLDGYRLCTYALGLEVKF